jgi:hypothetical protein
MLVSKSVLKRQNNKDSVNGIELKDEEDPILIVLVSGHLGKTGS